MLPRGAIPLLLASALLAGCTAIGNAPGEARRDHVVLAIAAWHDDAGTTGRDTAPLEAALERALAAQGDGADVEVVLLMDHREMLTGLAEGAYDAAILDPWTALAAQRSVNAHVALTADRLLPYQGTNVLMTYHFASYVVPSGVQQFSLKDLKGKRVAYPMEDPLSGYLLPASELVRQHLAPAAGIRPVDPHSYFGEVLYVQTYEEGYRALLDGRVDATISSTAMDAALESKMRATTRAVATMGPIPGSSVVYAPAFSGPTQQAFTAALLSFEGESASTMRPFLDERFEGWRVANPRDHLNLLQVAVAQTGLRRDEVGP